MTFGDRPGAALNHATTRVRRNPTTPPNAQGLSFPKSRETSSGVYSSKREEEHRRSLLLLPEWPLWPEAPVLLSRIRAQVEFPHGLNSIRRFLAAKPLSANGRRSYAHTLGTVVGDLGADLPLDEFTAKRLRRVLEDRWGDASAATWNNRLTAVGSFRRWVQTQGWMRGDPLAGVERRPQARDDTAPIRYEQLHALWTRPDIHVREDPLADDVRNRGPHQRDTRPQHRGPRRRGQAGCGQGQRRSPPRSGMGFGNRPPPAPLSGRSAAGTGVRHPPPADEGADTVAIWRFVLRAGPPTPSGCLPGCRGQIDNTATSGICSWRWTPSSHLSHTRSTSWS